MAVILLYFFGVHILVASIRKPKTSKLFQLPADRKLRVFSLDGALAIVEESEKSCGCFPYTQTCNGMCHLHCSCTNGGFELLWQAASVLLVQQSNEIRLHTLVNVSVSSISKRLLSDFLAYIAKQNYTILYKIIHLLYIYYTLLYISKNV